MKSKRTKKTADKSTARAGQSRAGATRRKKAPGTVARKVDLRKSTSASGRRNASVARAPKRPRLSFSFREFMRGRGARALALAMTFVAVGAGLGIGAKSAWTWVTHTPRLAIKEIVVRTGDRVGEAEVRRLADVALGDNVIAFRLRECVQAIELHPWVKRASVMRELPDRVVIEILERDPVAVIALGALYYVDDEGEIFKKVLPGEAIDYPAFTGITLSEAVDDKESVAALLSLGIEVVELSRDSLILPWAEVSEVRLEPGRGATVVRASDGVRIVLGRGELGDKWMRVERALVELGDETEKVAELDLNFESRVTVRLRDGYRVASTGDEPAEEL